MSLRYQSVRCRDCGRTYVCTPQDDYYDATTPTDGRCLACLVKGAGLGDREVLTFCPGGCNQAVAFDERCPVCGWVNVAP